MKKKIFLFLGISAVSFISYCFFPIVFFDENNPNQPGRILVEDRNGAIIIDKPNKFWYKNSSKINLNSDFVKNLITIEDKNFYSHFWIDIFSKLWALKNNISSFRIVSGWSTITEQMIKNKYFLENKRTYLQKAREAFLALSFSAYYSKDEILEEYLQNIYLWKNNYWVSSAIEVYFQKENLAALSNQEQVLLLSLVKYPGIENTSELFFQNYFEKIKQKLWFNFENKVYLLPKKQSVNILPWWENYPTIDAKLQKFTKSIIHTTLQQLADKNVTNAAVYAINPKNWEALIYQASRDFNSKNIDGEVDVIASQRQMWSTLKPFLYALALENWAGSESFLVDLDTQYESFQSDKSYTSSNYNLKNYGLVRLKKALWNSLNNASVRLVQHLWLQESFEWYEKLWFDFEYQAEHYGYWFVLWSPSLSLKSLVENYVKLIPNWEINNISEETKFLLYDILSDPDNRDLSFWVNSILNTSMQMAVKTGTSSNFRDNIVISYHPDLVIWVWVGNNDNSPMTGVTGITWAGYIWHQIAEKAIELWYIRNAKISTPQNISQANYCLDTKCFRKENIYVDTTKINEYFSAIADDIYDSRDIFIHISQEEKNLLEDMWF